MKRREFLAGSLATSVLPLFMNGFSLSGFGDADNETDDRVMVVIQLTGGNDGLNTVIPVASYGNYRNARANIAIPEKSLLKIPQADTIGLHPSLSVLSNMFREGFAGLIHDVGYPRPDFSHFRSADIWHSASDADQYISSGWAGRYLSALHPQYPSAYPNECYPDPLAIQTGAVMSLALQGPVHPAGISISDPSAFNTLLENHTDELPASLAGKELGFLRMVSAQTNRYAEVIKKAADRPVVQKEYPGTRLAAQLKIVARLVAGGLKTRFYYVSIGGFDTHSAQTEAGDTTKGAHAVLLKQLSEAIGAFHADLRNLGVSKRVAGMTYSEFGRRVKSNAGSGTDHGAAAPLFFFGDGVAPVVLGKPFDVPGNAGTELNVPMQYDFRSVYASVLKNWFCFPENETENVLFRHFQDLPVFRSGACGNSVPEPVSETGERFAVRPNPFTDFITFDFVSSGGLCLIHIFDLSGREVLRVLNEVYAAGKHSIRPDLRKLQTGVYMVRFQNQVYQDVVRIVKN